jgi:hypothetical protein
MPFAFAAREMPLGSTADAHVCLGASNGATNRAAAPVNRWLSASAFDRRLRYYWHGFTSGLICSALVSMVKANAQARRTPVLPPQGCGASPSEARGNRAIGP